MHVGYVRTRSGEFLLQLPAANPWGFVLCDDELSWPGGFGIADTWTAVPDSEVSEDVRQRLHWLLEEAREAEAEAEKAYP